MMKKLILFAGIIAIHSIGFGQAGKSKPVKQTPVKSVLKTEKDSLSYAIGAGIADNLARQGITNIDYALVQKGMEDVLKKRTRLLDESTAGMSIQKKLQEAVMKKIQAEKDKGNAFLEENRKRKGVTVLPSGLQYEIISTSSDSAMIKPTEEDTVVVNYIGTLTNGKEFDNSIKRGQPATFAVNGVIKGWTEILQLMPVGSKWKVYIPSELGYGDRGAGAGIPGGAVLVFEISLEGIKPAVKQ